MNSTSKERELTLQTRTQKKKRFSVFNSNTISLARKTANISFVLTHNISKLK